MSMASVIFMGGKASRLDGLEKHALKIGNKSCFNRVVSRLNLSSGEIFLSVASTHKSSLDDAQYPLIYDAMPHGNIDGVLNALLSVLRWGIDMDYDFIVTTTADTPFLPLNYVNQLKAAFASYNNLSSPIVSLSENRIHGLHALWPKAAMPKVINQIQSSGPISITRLHKQIGSLEHDFEVADYNPFFNINTYKDIEKANDITQSYTI